MKLAGQMNETQILQTQCRNICNLNSSREAEGIMPVIARKLSLILSKRGGKNMDSYNSPTTKPLYRGTQVVWYILGLLEALLAFRFVLKLLGANPSAGFSNFIYTVSYLFAAPFLNVFNIMKVEGGVFEWTTLLAMFVYWLIAWGIVKLFFMSKTISTTEAANKLDRENE
jgi:uncharacterized membrane protein YciS (DUF1049 family)